MNKQKQSTKNSKGITLVALIITIVVLLILAMAAIGAIRDSKIITHAQNAGSSYTIAQEKEQIGLAVSEWQLQKVIPGNIKSFCEVVDEALNGTADATDNHNGTLTVTFNKTRNVYTVDENGNITEQEDEIIGGADEPVTNDFEIAVTQSISNGDRVDFVVLDITPIIPETWINYEFTDEGEAVRYIAKLNDFNNTDGTIPENLEELLIAAVNTTDEITTPFNKDQYNEVITAINSIAGVNITTKEEAFAFMMTSMKLSYKNVQEWATDVYEYKPTSYSYKIRKNGGEWTDITDVTYWTKIWYQVNYNGSYEIEIQLNDKIARKQVQVKDITYLGKYVKYDSNGDGSVEDETILWRVLRDDDDKVELITANAVGKVDLTPSSFEEARNNYNDLINILVEECKRVTGITENIRNIGDDKIDKMTMKDTIKFSDFTTYKPYGDPKFENYEGEKGFKKDDEGQWHESDDFEQLGKALIGDEDVSESYWISDRNSQEDLSEVGFFIWYHHVYEDGAKGINGIKIAYFDKFGAPQYSINQDESYSNGVRPVLTLEPGVLDVTTQLGTKDNPIEIYQNK